MLSSRQPSITPKNGETLMVGIVARISGCADQKEISLDDQVDHGKEAAAELFDGQTDFHIIATKGKGERLDRPELAEIEELLRTGELDLLIVEDLGRLVRGTEAAWLCGIAVDHGTRVLVPNDCIDTADDSWEEDVISACRDHVGHNAHTSKRLKQKLMNRFKKFGGATARETYGYIKPPDAKTYADWQKDPAALQYVLEGFRRLKESLNCSAVADWFTDNHVPTGKYARSKKWKGALVRRLYRNTILIGQPGRGFRHTVKHHETGRRVSLPNPKGPVYVSFPHLAYLDPDEFRELNALLDGRNKANRRKPVNGVDPLLQRPRKRTRFPGQHARCWYCGRNYVWGGNGGKNKLMCMGAKEWRCWNGIAIDGQEVLQKITAVITETLYNLDGFDEQFAEMVKQATQKQSGGLAERWQQLHKDEERLTRESENLAAAVAKYGPKPMFEKKIQQCEVEQGRLGRERRQLLRLQEHQLELPGSVDELRRQLEKQMEALATDSHEFGGLLRKLVPDFHVYLVQRCNGGHLLPRAKIKLDLSGVVPDLQHVPSLMELLTRDVTVDLFQPTQRERIREEAVRLASQGLEQREIARQIAEHPTQTAVYNALKLDRKMRELGLDSPYMMVLQPQQNCDKPCRHKHPRYEFQTAEGYQQPAL